MQSLIPPPPNQKTALLLSGGGARAAYQVGVLKAIQAILYRGHSNPFNIICGVSAGAINATVLASHASHFRIGIRRLEDVWSNFSCDKVFRTDVYGLLLQMSRYASAMLKSQSNTSVPLAMLNSRPLRELLKQKVPFGSIARAISRGDLYAACITASSFTTGESVSFFQGHPEIEEWNRHRRLGRRAKLSVNHLMASSSIPLIFPPSAINQRYYGDGSVHFLSPLSPAVHLGADKVLIISVDPIGKIFNKFDSDIPPSMAEVAGHVFDSVLVDSLESDLERLERINTTLDVVDPIKAAAAGLSLKRVEPLVIAPDRELFHDCGQYFNQLPVILRFFMRAFGINSKEGQAVLSFLLFEQQYTKTLIERGFQDGMKNKAKLLDFFEQ
jgi:NTE family protein